MTGTTEEPEPEIRLRPPARPAKSPSHVVFGDSDDSGSSPDETSVLKSGSLDAIPMDVPDASGEDEETNADFLALFEESPEENSPPARSEDSILLHSPKTSSEADEEKEESDEEAPVLRLSRPDTSDAASEQIAGSDEDLFALMESIGDGTLVEELSDELEKEVVFRESEKDDAPPPDETSDVPIPSPSPSPANRLLPLAVGCLSTFVILLVLLAVPGWFYLQKYIQDRVQAEVENREADAVKAEPVEEPRPVASEPAAADGALPRPPGPADIFGAERVNGVPFRTEAEALSLLGIEQAEADGTKTPGRDAAAGQASTMPCPDRLNTMLAFLKLFPGSLNRKLVYRELLLDTTDLLQGSENNMDALVVDYCRAAISGCGEYISLDIWNEEVIQDCRRFVIDLCSAEEAAAAVLAENASRQALLDLVALFFVEFPEKRAANCRLSTTALKALGYGLGWERIGVPLIKTVNELFDISEGGMGDIDPYLDDAVTGAQKLVGQLRQSQELAPTLYTFAVHLHKKGRSLDAVRLIEAMEAEVTNDPWHTRLRRKRRVWDPDLARHDIILLRRTVARTYEERLPAALAGIDQELIARDLGLEWPVKAPTATLAQIEAQIQKLAETATEKAFPLSTLKEIEKEADARYQPFVIGNEVTVRLVEGLPGGNVIKGRFRERYPNAVKIAFRMIRTADIIEEDRIRLYPEECERRRRKLIEEKETTFNAQRRQLRKKAVSENTSRLYQEAGYLLRRGSWCSPVALLDGSVNERKQEVSSALRAAVEKEVYENEGFIRTSDGWHPVDPDIDEP